MHVISSPVDWFAGTLLVPEHHADLVVFVGTNITRKMHFVPYNSADSNDRNCKRKRRNIISESFRNIIKIILKTTRIIKFESFIILGKYSFGVVLINTTSKQL